MNHTMIRMLCLVLCLTMSIGFIGCAAEGDAVVKKMLESIAENEKLQAWMAEHDIATVTESAVTKLKESIPVLQEFLAREDVQEKLKTVGLPLIQEFLEYGVESMRLKAETLGNVIRIFAPELSAEVDAIFETAPDVPDNS